MINYIKVFRLRKFAGRDDLTHERPEERLVFFNETNPGACADAFSKAVDHLAVLEKKYGRGGARMCAWRAVAGCPRTIGVFW